MQAAQLLAVEHCSLGLLGRFARAFFIERDDGIEHGVGLGDALQTAVEQFDGRELLGCQSGGGLRRRSDHRVLSYRLLSFLFVYAAGKSTSRNSTTVPGNTKMLQDLTGRPV